MKVAVIGSRGLVIDILEAFIPPETTEIVSGGAKGIDTCARKFAEENEYRYTEFLPDYKALGQAAPLRRNDQIIEYSDLVVAFWDGNSRGTKYVIERCKELSKPIKVYLNNNAYPSDY
jgi:hypothetical protein